MIFSPIRSAALLGTLALATALPARADIDLTASAEPTTYARGRTNTYRLDLQLISEAFSGADALYFSLPEGVSLSAVRKRNTFSFCSDVYPTVMGMGSREGGWYQLGYPALDGCGSLSASPAPGELQVVLIDVDVPADYSGDLPVVVHVLGDGNGDAPNEASLTLTMADAGTPVDWGFDDVAAPALSGGWGSRESGDAPAWTTQAAEADRGWNAVHAPTSADGGESVLTGPAVSVPAGGAELQFRQRYATRGGRDGGVLEIAIDDGDFVDVLAAGGQFAAGGYGDALASDPACAEGANPLAGRAAWSGAQAAYGTTSVVLPAAAAGHRARFRWRLGSDCAGESAAANGWWIDSVRLTAAPPTISTPARLAVATNAGTQRTEPLDLTNAGSGQLDWSIAIGDGDCATPANPGWLHLDAVSGALAGGERGRVMLAFDSDGLAAGDHAALLCVSSNDAAQPLRQIPVRLTVEPDACPAADRLFANGFDDASDGRCGHALRVYDQRDDFLAHVGGHDEQGFNGLRTGYVNGPLRFGAAPYAYSVSAAPHTDLGDLYLFAGSGVLSTVSPGADSELAITFDAPVTAVGGQFWGQMFQDPTSIEANLQAPTTIVLTLDDGTTETFVANGQQDFRGLLASRPITGLRVRAPEPGDDGGYVWGVFDNLVVGDAR